MIKAVINTNEGFVTQYTNNEFIEQTIAKFDNGSIKVMYKNGEKFAVHYENLGFYQSQFGISVSDNGDYLFIQDWDSGLFCFEIRSNALKWKIRQKGIENLLVTDSHVIGFVREKLFLVIDINSGDVKSKIKTPAQSLLQLPEQNALIGPVKNEWHIVQIDSFKVVRKIDAKIFNPDDCISFLLNAAYYVGDELVIEGFEQDEAEMLADKPMNPFVRRINLH